MRISSYLTFSLAVIPAIATAQVRVSPTTVNVSTQGASTVFLSYGGLRDDQRSGEAVWCGRLISAAPHIGFRCDPATLWGQLPTRYDLSRPSGIRGFTDIMSIPPSIARRAYASAAKGDESTFFYVRRFISAPGLPDEYIVVRCLLAGGGASVPLALTDVRLQFAQETPVLFVSPGSTPPPWRAEITFTGTGRLAGRWEVVRPGDELPDEFDRLTEASLPLEQRGTQRRYTEIERFNIHLPPTGRVTLSGPDPKRLPTDVDGAYLVLLRIEASDDGAGNTDLSDVGAGSGIVRVGAVAGFPLPPLRYFVGAGESDLGAPSRSGPVLMLPKLDVMHERTALLQFTWLEAAGAAYHRLDVQRVDGTAVHSAIIAPGTGAYTAPPWLAERAGDSALRWRVSALDGRGRDRASTAWRRLMFTVAR